MSWTYPTTVGGKSLVRWKNPITWEYEKTQVPREKKMQTIVPIEYTKKVGDQNEAEMWSYDWLHLVMGVGEFLKCITWISKAKLKMDKKSEIVMMSTKTPSADHFVSQGAESELILK